MLQNCNKNYNKIRAFTLIELLVVVGIVAILATVGVVSFGKTRIKARDAKRKADLMQINKVLEIYLVEKEYLPRTLSYGEQGPGGWDYSSQDINGNGLFFLEFLITEGILCDIPLDPINNGTGDVCCPGLGGAGYSYAYYCYPAGMGGHPLSYVLGVYTLEETGAVWWVPGDWDGNWHRVPKCQ